MFGKQTGAAGGVGESVPAEEGLPIYEAAVQAANSGRAVFTCAVTVGFSTGSGMGFGGKKTSNLRLWDSGELIEAIEKLGWRLDRCDHVWAQTEQGATLGGATMIKGLTVAHMLFRKVGQPGSA
ncbi:MAG TPA: hypothetical protein VN408_43530 [Actinoplanes sp.]|nr:hypothetical protein [Actinoplanes sp.]